MSRSSPFVITLSDADRAELRRRARCYTAPHAEVVRAKIVLLVAEGLENTLIAGRLDVHVGVVSRWWKRFAQEGLSGPAAQRTAAGVCGGGGRGGQGDGVRATGRPGRAAVAVVSFGPGRSGRIRGAGGVGGAVDGAAVAGCRRDPAVAVDGQRCTLTPGRESSAVIRPGGLVSALRECGHHLPSAALCRSRAWSKLTCGDGGRRRSRHEC